MTISSTKQSLQVFGIPVRGVLLVACWWIIAFTSYRLDTTVFHAACLIALTLPVALLVQRQVQHLMNAKPLTLRQMRYCSVLMLIQFGLLIVQLVLAFIVLSSCLTRLASG